MVRPNSALSGLFRLAFGAAALALSSCATDVPTVRFASDGGISRIGESAAGNYLAGRQAGLRQDTRAAADFFARALEADPENAAVLERAFLLDIAAGDIEGAAMLARKISAKDPSNRIAHLILSVEALKARRYQVALDQIGSGDPQGSLDVVWTAIKAWAHAGFDQTDQGLALLRAGEVRAALGPYGLYHEALILDYAGRHEEADKAYGMALQAAEGRSVRVLEAYGRFLEREGRQAEAMRLYTTYLAVVPDHPVIVAALDRASAGGRAPAPLVSVPPAGAAEALYGISVVLASEHAIDLPVVYSQLALYLWPQLEPAYALLGDLYEQQENWEQAIASYTRIPESSPVARLAAVSIARDYARMDRSDEAIALLRKWVAKGARDVDTFVTLGDLYRAEEQWELAAQHYDKALQAIPQSDTRSWQIVYAKGISLERAGKWDEAEPLLRKALELEPDQPQVLNYLGYSWIDRGENLKEALSLIDRAVAQRPDDGYVVDSLGWAYYRLGDYQTAVYYLEHAVELKADDPTINDHLGDAYWRIGRRLEARFQWTHALAFDPSEEEAKAIRQKLEEGLADLSEAIARGHGS